MKTEIKNIKNRRIIYLLIIIILTLAIYIYYLFTQGYFKRINKTNPINLMKKIETNMTLNEVNKIIGKEGKLTNERYKEYTWEFKNNSKIKIRYFDETTELNKNNIKSNIIFEIKDEELKNMLVKFPKKEILNEKVSKGMKYTDMKKIFNNVEGDVVEKTPYAITYKWVDKNGKYVKARFISTGVISMFMENLD